MPAAAPVQASESSYETGADKLEREEKTTGKKTVVERNKHPHKDDKTVVQLLLSILLVPADSFQGLQ